MGPGLCIISLSLDLRVLQSTKMGPLCFLMLINDALTNTLHRW